MNDPLPVPRTSSDDDLTGSAILVIDDSAANLRLLERIFSQAGFTNVHTAVDGESGLEVAREIEPDLILLDLHMPGMGGVEVLKQLRSRLPRESYLPVLVLTADASFEAKREALASGAMDFLTKPFDAAEVMLRVRNLLHTRSLHTNMEEKVLERTAELEQAHAEILERLAHAGEFRDRDTGQHTRRVGDMSALLARTLGLSRRDVSLIQRAAPLHDIGKIGVSDTILLKSGKLTEEEWIVMKRHTTFGAKILADARADVVRTAALIALCHHEKWDGSGYPRGLRGEEIPLEARIVAVADVFDALSHDRPYRPALPQHAVIAEIQQGSGSHFDPKVVEAFLALMKDRELPAGEAHLRSTPPEWNASRS